MAYRQRKEIPSLVKNPRLIEARRQQIIEAAVKLFIEKGFHRATTREIARRAGFSIGTLYEYVESKEDVLYLVCEQIHEEMEASIRRAVENSGDQRETLRRAMAHYFSVCDRMQDEILLVYQETKSLEYEAMKFVLKNDERVSSVFHDILRTGYEDGSFRFSSERQIGLTADNIVVLGHMWAFRRWRLSRHYTLGEYTEQQTSLVLNEIGAA